VSANQSKRSGWLFSRRVDLGVFLAPAVVSLVVVAVAETVGLRESPDWSWITAVLLVDVAHVWATGFRVYLDPDELRRRPARYVLIPIAAFAIGVLLYSQGEMVFWRALAYLAVFHFVRQQAGWVLLYRARAGERDRLGRRLDLAAVYVATLYPLLWWHAHLPRRFSWFLAGDFAGVPPLLAAIAAPIWAALLLIYAARAVVRYARRRGTPGKDIVVVTTAACWYAGIVATNSDFAFTVTNVLIHGIPYFALVYWYGRRRATVEEGRGVWRMFARGPGLMLATLWAAAFIEELLWDKAIWHDRAWLFGAPFDLGDLRVVVVPLLALPQLTHYILDGFIWRRRNNPRFDLV